MFTTQDRDEGFAITDIHALLPNRADASPPAKKLMYYEMCNISFTTSKFPCMP